jgi:hypothetical protein
MKRSKSKLLKIKIKHLDYSRTKANPPHPYIKVEEVAREALVNCREPTQANPGYKEADAVRLVD